LEIKLSDYLKASYPCLFLCTAEPGAAEMAVYSALRELDLDMRVGVWSVTRGLMISDHVPEPGNEMANNMSPENEGDDFLDALDYLAEQPKRSDSPLIVIFYNVRHFMNSPQAVQKVIDTISAVEESASHLIFAGAHIELPIELQSMVTWVDIPLPSQEEMEAEIRKLTAAYRNDISLPDKKDEQDNQIALCARAAAGLDILSAKNAFALSISKNKALDVETVQAQKQAEIRKSDVLEFFPWDENMKNVGGFSEYKAWINRRKAVFSKEAREYGLPYPKGVLICGVAGCLDKDTRIMLRKPNGAGGRFYTIEQLYYKFHGLIKEGKLSGALTKRQKSCDRSRPVRTHSYDEERMVIVGNDIEDVYFSGIKPVYKMVTEDGLEISATLDHKFYTLDGEYVPLGELNAGDEVVVYTPDAVGDVVENHKTGRNKNRQLVQTTNVGNHPNARIRAIKGLTYTEHPLHRLVFEADMNGMQLENFLWALQGDVSNLAFLNPHTEIHHKDFNRLNNTLQNLEALSKEEHARLHYYIDGPPNKYQIMGRRQKISEIGYIGERPTYDISMAYPLNNFIADGFVVHNSGKSLTAKSTASYLELPLVRLDMGKVFKSLVGSSEEAMRTALKTIEGVAPVVAWIDEIEKALSGSRTSGELDSGVTSRVISTFLTWRQETKSAVFCVATANDISGLEGMVQRRFDAIWAVDLPGEVVRQEIFEIHLRKRGRDPEEFDTALLAKRSDGFVGSEIEQAVEDGMFYGFFDNREFTTEDILASITETIPQSSRNKEEIQALRDWIEGRARLVDRPNGQKKNGKGKVRTLK